MFATLTFFYLNTLFTILFLSLASRRISRLFLARFFCELLARFLIRFWARCLTRILALPPKKVHSSATMEKYTVQLYRDRKSCLLCSRRNFKSHKFYFRYLALPFQQTVEHFLRIFSPDFWPELWPRFWPGLWAEKKNMNTEYSPTRPKENEWKNDNKHQTNSKSSSRFLHQLYSHAVLYGKQTRIFDQIFGIRIFLGNCFLILGGIFGRLLGTFYIVVHTVLTVVWLVFLDCFWETWGVFFW